MNEEKIYNDEGLQKLPSWHLFVLAVICFIPALICAMGRGFNEVIEELDRRKELKKATE